MQSPTEPILLIHNQLSHPETSYVIPKKITEMGRETIPQSLMHLSHVPCISRTFSKETCSYIYCSVCLETKRACSNFHHMWSSLCISKTLRELFLIFTRVFTPEDPTFGKDEGLSPGWQVLQSLLWHFYHRDVQSLLELGIWGDTVASSICKCQHPIGIPVHVMTAPLLLTA